MRKFRVLVVAAVSIAGVLSAFAPVASAEAGKNRAAVQIQGAKVNNVTKSWSTDNVIYGSDASTEFATLLSKQSTTQRARVDKATNKAQIYVSLTCPLAAGCQFPGKSGFTNTGVKGSDARADAPVYAGLAFE